jgi:hypothetical protein
MKHEAVADRQRCPLLLGSFESAGERSVFPGAPRRNVRVRQCLRGFYLGAMRSDQGASRFGAAAVRAPKRRAFRHEAPEPVSYPVSASTMYCKRS